MFIIVLFVIACLIVFPVHAGSGLDMNPGLWEITTEVKMSGMTMPKTTNTQCITKDSMVPQAGTAQGQGQCEMKDIRTHGDTVNWSIECSGQGGAMTGTGEITYHGNTFEGTSSMSMQGMDIKTIMKGRRIGECQK